ncbi:UNVERIFIED_ORG: uncharacterized protein DUF4056 [Citrobacter freundii]
MISAVHLWWSAGLTGLAIGIISSVQAGLPVPVRLDGCPGKTDIVWPVMPPLPEPDGLRTCCAFGYDMRVRLPGMTAALPFYRVDNVVGAGTTGGHRYNDQQFTATLNGAPAEHNGIAYTVRGGFVDTAHVRDTADMTVWIFTHLWPRLGEAFVLTLAGEELAQRRLVFQAFTPPSSGRERYVLAAGMAARLAWQLAVWHEIAQWYGFESVPGFSEAVSAFSPEDLWSNLLGARIAESLILTGHVASRGMYEVAMGNAMQQILVQLGVLTHAGTQSWFRQLDGQWWDSRQVLPEKTLVLRRNYDTGERRCPTPAPGEEVTPLCLTLPLSANTMPAELQLWPGHDMRRLPVPVTFYTVADFERLAFIAEALDTGREKGLFAIKENK